MKNYLLPILVVLLFFAACTPQQATPDAPMEDTMDDTADAPAEMPEAQEPEAPEQEAVAPEPESSSAFDELMGLFDEQANLEYQVAYDMTTKSQGQTMSSKMSQYVKGTSHMRIDMESEGMQIRTYMVEKKLSSCMNQGSWTCFEMDSSDENTGFDANEFRENVESNPVDYDVTLLAPRTIAGAVTACFAITTDDASTDYCMTRTGVPLYVHFVAENAESTMTATSFSTSVPANAFDLPAEPGDMAAMMGGFDPSAYQ